MTMLFFRHFRNSSSRKFFVILITTVFSHEGANQFFIKIVLVFLVLVSRSIAAGISGLLLFSHPLQLQMLKDVHLAKIAVEESLMTFEARESLHQLVDFR